MSFRLKIVVVFLLASIIPVLFSGILSIRTSQREMMDRTSDYLEKTATVAADAIDRQFQETVHALKLSTTLIPFDQFPKEDLPDAVRIPFRQFNIINAAALLNAKGKLITDPIYEEIGAQTRAQEHARHPLTENDVVQFLKQIDTAKALRSSHAFSVPYVCDRTRSGRVALAIAFPVLEGRDYWILAVELSLTAVDTRLKELAPKNGVAVIVDNTGQIISPADRGSHLKDRPVVADGTARKLAVASVYSIQGIETMGVFAPIPFLGWGLVIEQPATAALAPVYRIRNHTVLWTGLGIVVAILGGFLLGRGIGRPIIELAKKARHLAAGRFDDKIVIQSNDEIGQLGSAFNNMSAQLEKRIEQLENLFNSSTRTLVAAVEAKDRYTAGHSERVTAYALVLSDMVGLTKRERAIVEISALLHDVGKIGVPESILNKPGRLIRTEYDVIKYHPIQGADIVKKIDHPFAEEVAAAVRAHHERWDGRGYPDGLTGSELSIVARILTVADAFDAMTSNRAYRKGLSPEVAISRLVDEAGSQFDAELVELFSQAFKQGLLEEIFRAAKTLPPLTRATDEEATVVTAGV
jgi:HD-GYP domain-containing protein (c-di-GMP phosphodiesterase class II)